MLMQKHSPTNNKQVIENEEINVNSMDSLHSNGHFFSGRNPSLAGSECNDDKSIDACSSDDESHEHDNTEQENQTSLIDSSNREHFKSSLKKTKKKSVKVKFAGSQEDKAGIKLKIRRTNNLNQDENHIIVDNVEQQRKRHLKNNNKRCKSLSQNSFIGKVKVEETSNQGCSDDNMPQKRIKMESEDEFRVNNIGMNTISKGTEVDEGLLGACQAGTRLSLESVVLMETKSGILIVSVQWRGKTLMGALMESERFQIGSIEKDSIYRREKILGMNRRNTRRKSKNLFGKKKRKLMTATDSGEHAGTENEAGNSDVDNPYCCDKESCHMRFADFQTLRVHIYQKHRIKGENQIKNESVKEGECASLFRTSSSILSHLQLKPSIPDLVRPEPANGSEERNTFSPAYSDISDANEAPVLENEAEMKPSSGLVSQPAINLSLCQNPTLLAVSNRMLFSPTAPALQPEVTISSSQLTNSRLTTNQDGKLSHIGNYRFPMSTDPGLLNGYLHSLPTNHKPPNGALALSSSSNIPQSESCANSIQDLSLSNNSLNVSNVHKLPYKLSESNNHHHKTAPINNMNHSHKQPPVNRHQSNHHIHNHHHNNNNLHSNNNINGLIGNHNSKHYISSENGVHNQPPLNGVPLSHNLAQMSFSPSVNNQNNKHNFPINHMSLYQQKF